MSKILVVILNWRSAEMSLAAVEAARVAMQGLSGAINLVDNASGDGSYESMQRHIRAQGWDLGPLPVQLLQSGHNGGYGFGNNHGIRAGLPDGSVPDYIYLQNSDAFPAAEAIAALSQYLDAHPMVGMAGSALRGREGERHSSGFRFPSIAGELEAHSRIALISRLFEAQIVSLAPSDTLQLPDWVSGASLMLRRQMLDQIGLFDEEFFLYFEETELCRRAADAGWGRVVLPQSQVMHIGSVSTGMRQWQRIPGFWLDSRHHYFRKCHGRAYALWATAAALTGLGLWQIKRLVTRHRRIDPLHYGRDLFAHQLRQFWPRKPREKEPRA